MDSSTSTSKETQAIKEYYFCPQTVIESRWNHKEMKPDGFVPEVSFYGEHYILSAPQPTRDAAKTIADTKVAEMKAAMLAVGMNLITGFKKAKE